MTDFPGMRAEQANEASFDVVADNEGTVWVRRYQKWFFLTADSPFGYDPVGWEELTADYEPFLPLDDYAAEIVLGWLRERPWAPMRPPPDDELEERQVVDVQLPDGPPAVIGEDVRVGPQEKVPGLAAVPKDWGPAGSVKVTEVVVSE